MCHPRKRGHRPLPSTHDHLVHRQFHANGPDRLCFTDITQHRAEDGWVYCCAMMDAWSRRIVGWAITDHIRSELIVDALQMARSAAPHREPSSTWTGAVSTPAGCSGSGCPKPGCSA